MRKIFSLMLMATALLISGNAKAENEIKVTIGQSDFYYSTLKQAFDKIIETPKTKAVINLEGTPEKLVHTSFYLNNEADVEIKMNGYSMEFEFCSIFLEKAKLNFTGAGNVLIKGAYMGSLSEYPKTEGWAPGSDKEGHALYGDCYKFLRLKGSVEDVAEYTILTIGKDIVFDGFGYVAVVDNNNKCGFGAQINISGYLRSTFGLTVNGTIQTDGTNLPEINIYPGATIIGGVYCAGLANYNIDGATIIDNGYDNAIYVKGGHVVIKDATIIATGEYIQPTYNGTGASGGGSAIVYDSNMGYAGMSMSISGNTTVTSAQGYAIEECVTSGEDKLATLTITGGNFSGNGNGDNQCIKTSDEFKTHMVNTNSIQAGIYNDNIESFVNAANTVITYVDTEDGQKWTIGSKPANEWKETLASAGEGDYVQLKSAAPVTETVNVDKKIAYLAILNANKVVVEGATLRVGEIVINEDAQLVIKADAKVIVENKQGIISTSTDNLIIEANEQSNGMLLINPEVTFNTTPMATVELAAYSWSKDANDYAYQRFAIPTGGTLESVESEDNVSVGFYKYNGVKWVSIGFLNPLSQSYSPLDLDQLNEPFTYYQMIVNSPTPGKKITFKGRLAGNTSPKLTMPAGQEWIGFANSYMGKVDNETLIDALGKSVYRCTSVGNHKYQWDPVSNFNLDVNPDLKVMEAFMIHAEGQAIELQLDYKTMIWDYNTK